MARFALLHSPLLGAGSWRATAAALRDRGHEASAPPAPRLSDLHGGFYVGLAQGWAELIETEGGAPPILVAHSGAGAIVPELAARLNPSPAGAIFADAILPHPGRSWFDTAPPDLRDQLRAAGQAGWLPAWNEWWPPGALERLVPDPALLADLVSELEPPPIGYFEEPAPDRGVDISAAYLKLSGAYEDEAEAAARLGWPVVRLPFDHLAPVTRPEATALALDGLASRIATRGS